MRRYNTINRAPLKEKLPKCCVTREKQKELTKIVRKLEGAILRRRKK